MNSKDILDREHLAKYTLGDASLEREVLGLFVGQVPQSLALLQASSDARSWLRAAHTIKGSARVIGAWKLAEAAARAESAAADCTRWDELVGDIAAAVQEVRGRIAMMEPMPA
jgi:HPt (histidine-containing phosphotransfer) domain-containing protein